MARKLGHLVQVNDPSDDVAIRVENVSKSFKLPHNKQNSLKSGLINLVSNGDRSFETQEVLKDVSFEIKKGEFFGIVGRNGSGKSTLLKMLAGIYTPSKGKIIVNGSLTPFIELGVGFNPELTGRENVYLNGALLGFSRTEMAAMYDDIVAFAELERFMDQKLKNYSSGMQVRLAFSIAIRAQSDILLIDEVLAVGDAAFQQKCYDYFEKLKASNQTIVLVTHDMSAVVRFCNRALILHDGDILAIGKPKEVTDKYLELNYTSQPDSKDDGLASAEYISEIKLNGSSKNGQVIKSGRQCQIDIGFVNPREIPVQFGLQIFNYDGTYCFGTNTKVAGLTALAIKRGRVSLSCQPNLVSGEYSITAALMDENGTKVLVYKPKLLIFRVDGNSGIEGVADLKHDWEMQNV